MLRSNRVFTISSGVPSAGFAEISEKLSSACDRLHIEMFALSGCSNAGSSENEKCGPDCAMDVLTAELVLDVEELCVDVLEKVLVLLVLLVLFTDCAGVDCADETGRSVYEQPDKIAAQHNTDKKIARGFACCVFI